MRKFAFVFPGQGSQSIGMLSAFFEPDAICAQSAAIISEIYQQASDALDYDMAELISQGPVEKLNATEFTQPALLAAGVACWKVWQSQSDLMPSYVAGHSLGEYTALVCSDVLSFHDAIKLVAARGRYMQEAAPEGVGAMAAILGLDNENVEKSCQAASDVGMVSPANFNSVGQVVIAGEAKAVDQAIIYAKEFGAKIAKRIPVSVPSHCHLMKPAAEKLAKDLANINFRKPKIALINNVDVKIENEAEKIKDALVRQLYCPVQWVKTIELIQQKEVSLVAECGPGKVLTGLIKRINKQLETVNLNTAEQMINLSKALSMAI